MDRHHIFPLSSSTSTVLGTQCLMTDDLLSTFSFHFGTNLTHTSRMNDLASIKQGYQKNLPMQMKGFGKLLISFGHTVPSFVLTSWKEDVVDNQVEISSFRSFSRRRVGHIFHSDLNI